MASILKPASDSATLSRFKVSEEYPITLGDLLNEAFFFEATEERHEYWSKAYLWLQYGKPFDTRQE